MCKKFTKFGILSLIGLFLITFSTSCSSNQSMEETSKLEDKIWTLEEENSLLYGRLYDCYELAEEWLQSYYNSDVDEALNVIERVQESEQIEDYGEFYDAVETIEEYIEASKDIAYDIENSCS